MEIIVPIVLGFVRTPYVFHGELDDHRIPEGRRRGARKPRALFMPLVASSLTYRENRTIDVPLGVDVPGNGEHGFAISRHASVQVHVSSAGPPVVPIFHALFDAMLVGVPYADPR